MSISEKIKSRIHTLPTLPTIYHKLTESMQNPRVTTEDVAKIISTDQAASFKVLKVANSPFYGFSGRIETITRAILHLGFNEVKNIVLALSVINLFSKHKKVETFRPVDFWAHSIGVGIASRMIGAYVGISNLENFFLAGILHDIGKLLFLEFADDEYSETLRVVKEKKIPIRQAEKETLGLDHPEAGRLLADRWKLPLTIKNAIYNHHEGFVGDKPDLLVASVHVGNIVSRIMEMGYAGDDLIPEPNEKVWGVLNLPEQPFTGMVDELMQNYEETVGLLLRD
ncbi:MAG: HDOD domain-containing protein [Ignavibacteriales bacterium]|nr:HDOD domain-containing protein [Ignavibacteriales bacterium]